MVLDPGPSAGPRAKPLAPLTMRGLWSSNVHGGGKRRRLFPSSSLSAAGHAIVSVLRR
jgi:hypothetical protein